MTAKNSWDIEVGIRTDGEPWRLRAVEFKGSEDGPSTAFVAGVYGDKPLASLALIELERRLEKEESVHGTVLIIPVANPPAFEIGTRIGPDHLYLNRQFPGKVSGFVTDQIAHHLFNTLKDRSDCIVDVHSGTPDMGLWYGYDYGDLALSSSFGYIPVVVDHPVPGTLCDAASAAGIKTFAVEFGGGANGDITIGVEGCLNVLRHRGHLQGVATGPAQVPVIDRVHLWLPSMAGALLCRYGTQDVGRSVEQGTIAWIVNVQTGETLEDFTIDEEGGLLMLARATPAMVLPGSFACMVGFAREQVKVAGGGSA